ncbi:centrosomal protein of 70 kDa-like isoform X2 [Biomphalaria glabrata]|uniref:Centrosomal protein of 70 kDa n=1 Tax=Biomphalaria glabrata TaxID=6526 RepID=A0A9W2YA70_BIOGL|nr:centrosomal protein of 70 kDa-like isoform X2 [Biomphalaria glabrata]
MADYGYRSSCSRLEFPNDDVSNYSDDQNTLHSSRDEIREWMDVNRKLRKHGLEAIHILPSNEVNLHSDRYICIDVESSHVLRTAIVSLILEVNRKDNMMQELTKSNSQLQKEVSQLTDEIDLLNAKSKDIKVMLECSRARVQEMERERSTPSFYSEETQRLRSSKSSVTSKCILLEAKVAEQEKELDRLRNEVNSFVKEEANRSKRQTQIVTDIKKRNSCNHSPVDQKLLDIIESYETQIQTLQRQLEGSRSEESITQDDGFSYSVEPRHNVQAIVKSYEKRLSEKEKKIKKLEEENKHLRLDLGSKYDGKDYRMLSQRVKKLERLLHLHNISIPGEKSVADPFERSKRYSTHLNDLDLLPLSQCQQYLKLVCKELDTDDLDCLVSTIQELKDEGQMSNRFHDYCKELAEIVEGLNEGCHRSRSTRLVKSPDNFLCDSNMRYYLEVIQNWRKDISGLGGLQDALNHLLDKVVPWMRAHMDRDHSVDEMTELVERVVHADKQETNKVLVEDVSRSTLESIVSHFQTLFDVPRISGIFPRMNDIYRTIGESKNVMNTLKSMLGLELETHASGLVDAVGKLCHIHNTTTAKQLKKLLQTDDLQGVIRRLEEHSEFFPAFHSIMHKLFDILGEDKYVYPRFVFQYIHISIYQFNIWTLLVNAKSSNRSFQLFFMMSENI